MQKVCLALLDGMSALAASYPDQFSIDQDIFTQLREELDCPEVAIHLWYNEDRSVARAESDLYTTSDEYIMTIVCESLNTETEGLCFRISLSDGSFIDEGFYFVQDPSGAKQFGFFLNSIDACGNTEQTVDLYFGSDTYEDSDSLYAVLSTTDGSGTTELGSRYFYQDFSEDSVSQRGGYLIIWYNTYDDEMVQTDSYTLSFALDIVRGSYDTDGTLSTESAASIVEIDQMSDEDIQQAQVELQGVLQNFIMGAMRDPGVQQLFILFSGMLNFIQGQNM